jgi:hypothetical protein
MLTSGPAAKEAWSGFLVLVVLLFSTLLTESLDLAVLATSLQLRELRLVVLLVW